MQTILPALILLAAAAAPAAGAIPPPSPEAAQFHGLFIDWSSASRQSIENERAAAARPAAAPGQGAGSVALGEQVGDVVALGDCAEGERLARAAGDFALVAAVRRHCTAAAPAH